MSKWIAKPVTIDAYRFGHQDEIQPRWFSDAIDQGAIVVHYEEAKPYCTISTLEGTMRGDFGDYIILGTRNELYPCKPDVFEKKYAKED